MGKRFAGRTRRALPAVAAIVLALLFGSTWLWRDRLFPTAAVNRLVMRYGAARNEKKYGDLIACMTPEYLRRELGDPPYAPKLRRPFERERAQLDPGGQAVFCLHGPSRVQRVPGTRLIRARVDYHYNGSSVRLGMMRWPWEFTFRPWRRTWRIADTRLRLEEVPTDTNVRQGPAGTVLVLKSPPP